MAQEFIEFLSPTALKSLEEANKKLIEMVANVDKVGDAMKQINTPSGSDASLKSLTAQYKEQERTIQSLQKQLQKLTEKQNDNNASAKQTLKILEQETKNRQALDKQRQTALNQLAKEEQKLNTANNMYNKLQAKLNTLSAEYKNLAARKAIGLKLSADEEKNYTRLQAGVLKYENALRAVDVTMNKHQRNVGNYGGGLFGINNSINQLTREMPAFTYSVQTGFMALSNNIPIFTDAIGNAVRINKELQAQGKPFFIF